MAARFPGQSASLAGLERSPRPTSSERRFLVRNPRRGVAERAPTLEYQKPRAQPALRGSRTFQHAISCGSRRPPDAAARAIGHPLARRSAFPTCDAPTAAAGAPPDSTANRNAGRADQVGADEQLHTPPQVRSGPTKAESRSGLASNFNVL